MVLLCCTCVRERACLCLWCLEESITCEERSLQEEKGGEGEKKNEGNGKRENRTSWSR